MREPRKTDRSVIEKSWVVFGMLRRREKALGPDGAAGRARNATLETAADFIGHTVNIIKIDDLKHQGNTNF